jgi:hypothetical protein
MSLQPSPSPEPISLLSQISLDPPVHHVLSLLQACGALRLCADHAALHRLCSSARVLKPLLWDGFVALRRPGMPLNKL